MALTLGGAITIGVIGGTRAGWVVLVSGTVVFRQGILRHWRVGANRWKLNGTSRGIRVVLGTLCCLGGGSSACAFLGGLALRFLLLLASLPLLANLLELYKMKPSVSNKSPAPMASKVMHTFRSPLCSMRLHRDVRIQVVECTVSLLAAIPSALVHALDFLEAPAWSLMLGGAGDRDERINLLQHVD